MIKASDFRLGNLVNYFVKNEGFYETIIDIEDLERIKNHENCNCDFCSDYYYEPITITEEWLLRFGFEKSFKNGFWSSKKIGDKRLLISILGNVEIENWDKTMIGFLSICEYVHQLQNLYFVLTGEELTNN